MRQRVRGLWVALTVALAMPALLAPVPALAQQKNKVFDEAWERGQDFFNLGKYDEARAQFEKARDQNPKSPGPWRYLGRIARLQERWEACVLAATEAIKLKPDSPNAPEVRGDIEECRVRLGRPPMTAPPPEGQGALAVESNVEGAVVTVDGVRKGSTPLSPAPLVPGKHTVAVSKEGYLPVEVEAEVVVSIATDVIVDLEVDPDYKPPEVDVGPKVEDIKVGWIVVVADAEGVAVRIDGQAPPAGPQGSFEATPGEHILEVDAPGREPYRRRIRVARGQKRTVQVTLKSSSEQASESRLGYVFFGVAAAAATTGIVFGYLENQAYEDARDAYALEQSRPPGATLPPGAPEADVTTREEYGDMKSKAETYGLVGNVAFATAAVALGVSIYYFVQARPGEREGYPPPYARGPSRPSRALQARRPALIPTLLGGGEQGLGGGLVLSGEMDW